MRSRTCPKLMAVLLATALVASCSETEPEAPPSDETPSSSEEPDTDDLTDQDDAPATEPPDELEVAGQSFEDVDGFDVCELIDPTEVLVGVGVVRRDGTEYELTADDVRLEDTLMRRAQSFPACQAVMNSLPDGIVTWGVRDPAITTTPDPLELLNAWEQVGEGDEIDLEGVTAAYAAMAIPERDGHFNHLARLAFEVDGLEVVVDGRNFRGEDDEAQSDTRHRLRTAVVETGELLVEALRGVEEGPRPIQLDDACPPSDGATFAELLDGPVVAARTSSIGSSSTYCEYASEGITATLHYRDHDVGDLMETPFEDQNRELFGHLHVVMAGEDVSTSWIREEDRCWLEVQFEATGVYEEGASVYPSEQRPDLADQAEIDAFYEGRAERLEGLMVVLYEHAWDHEACTG